MKRVVICCFLILTLLLNAFVCPAAAADATLEEGTTSLPVDPGSVDDLLALGYPADFLQGMTQQTVSAVLSSLQTVPGSEVLRVSTEKGICSVNQNDMQMQSAAAVMVDPQTGYLTGLAVCVRWQWAAGKPFFRGEDANLLHVSWEQEDYLYDQDSFYFISAYRPNDASPWLCHSASPVLADISHGSLSAQAPMKTFARQVGGAMVFYLLPTDAEREPDLDSPAPLYYVNYENRPEPLRMILLFALRFLLPIVIIVVLILIIRAIVKRRRKRKQTA